MSTFSEQIIVLNATKTGDNSLVVHALSRSLGRRSFITNISRGKKALYEPLSIIDVEITENPKSGLWRLKGASAAHPLEELRCNMQKNAITLFISETLWRSLKDGGGKEIFDWLLNSILLLEARPAPWSNFHLHWLLRYAAALGFSPSPEDIAAFAGEHLEEIRYLLQEDFSDCMRLPLKGKDRSEIATALLEYISFHNESPLHIRSLEVLSQIFG